MKLSARKIKALFSKDLKDSLKNTNAIIMVALPLLFCILYSFMGIGGEELGPSFVLFISVQMNLCMVPIAFLSLIIAEEKEKNTLRTLMLANVSAGDFMLSKALVAFLYMELVNLLCFVITKSALSLLPAFLLITALSGFSIILIGALLGILAQNQMSAGTLTVPVMLLLLLPSLFSAMNAFFAAIAKWTPTYDMMQLFFGQMQGESLVSSNSLFQIGVIVGWTVLAAAAFVLVYRKRRLDN